MALSKILSIRSLCTLVFFALLFIVGAPNSQAQMSSQGTVGNVFVLDHDVVALSKERSWIFRTSATK